MWSIVKGYKANQKWIELLFVLSSNQKQYKDGS